MSKRYAGGVVSIILLVALALPLVAQASMETGTPEFVKNGKRINKEHTPILGYGPILLFSPQVGWEFECVNLVFGSLWNEGGPQGGEAGQQGGRGQILEWWASGHGPRLEYRAVSTNCRVVNKGNPDAEEVWATAEPPLKQEEERVVLAGGEEKTVVTAVTREPLSLPWNLALTVKEGLAHARIGIPSETGKSCEEIPAPPGCVRIDVVVPGLSLQLPFEGYIEPKAANGTKNAISPSTWVAEGEKEPALSVNGEAAMKGYRAGWIRIFSYGGQELITVK